MVYLIPIKNRDLKAELSNNRIKIDTVNDLWKVFYFDKTIRSYACLNAFEFNLGRYFLHLLNIAIKN